MSINTTPAEQGVRLDIQAVDKSYGARKVLRNTRLTIEPGQFVAIVGRSGCGKSTLGNAEQVPRVPRIPALGGLRRCTSSQ